MDNAGVDRAGLGIHNWLYISAVPATGDRTLIGKRLIDAGVLGVAGVYECEFRADGVGKLEARLKATFASGSATTSGGSLYADRTAVLQAWTGVGAMSTTVEQALTIAAMKGEKYGKVIITTVGVLVQFTVAEVLGV
jgi:hypothetical protein